jgi:hypothetical protein
MNNQKGIEVVVECYNNVYAELPLPELVSVWLPEEILVRWNEIFLVLNEKNIHYCALDDFFSAEYLEDTDLDLGEGDSVRLVEFDGVTRRVKEWDESNFAWGDKVFRLHKSGAVRGFQYIKHSSESLWFNVGNLPDLIQKLND